MTLRVRNLQKGFGAVQALRGVDLDLAAGQVHAICGENGAGKSTLLSLLSGVLQPDRGQMWLDGEAFSPRHVREAEARGLVIVHQELALAEQMTVAENLFLGREPLRHRLIDHDTMEKEATRVLAGFGASIDPAARIADLSVAQAQVVEIARALSKHCRVLLLDEPSAALSRTETDVLLERVRALAKSGVACAYVSHRLPEVFAVASQITVLRDGRTAGTFETAQTSEAEIVRAMVGREVSALYPRRRRTLGPTVLEVRDLSVGTKLSSLTFTVRAGEVLGVSGLMGAGKSELLLHLYGAYGERTGGEVKLSGVSLPPLPPERAVQRGMALVPEDRKRAGIFPQQSIGFHLWPRLELFERLGVHAPSVDAQVTTLSGGNQQKVVLGKSLAHDPILVLLDEPTRGIDVGARAEIYEQVNALTDAGKAVILASSDLMELCGMCDRILVLARGRVVRELQRPDEATLLEVALANAEGLPTRSQR
jgi:D-xylose transport system ATP-binding protein